MAQSKARDRSLLRMIIASIFALITSVLTVVNVFAPDVAPDWIITVGVAGAASFYMLSFRSPDELRQVESRERVRTAEQDLENALRGLQGTVIHGDVVIRGQGAPPPGSSATETQEDAQPRLALSELWAVTHRRLDHYHGIALGQAKQSFRNAQVAMVLGFTLLVGFVIVALNASTTAGSVVAGGLGAVSAALAGYVSSTFIKSQEVAAGHLRAYFDQPLEFSRYLAAERLMADAGLSEEKQAEILSMIVQSMIAGPVAMDSSRDEPAAGS
ncbi:hypothetical protein [Streptomyces sp. NPDC052292]|uniref:hypothetical protein n=1 Tax=Streptomyces sp. NPDC052292 TaxID=3155053 RepID=UPI00341AAA22